jgi:hypothetical protein
MDREMNFLGEFLQKPFLGLIVPVGLADGAARGADRGKCPPRTIGALFVGRRIFLPQYFSGAQIGILLIAVIFENERLGAVAHHNPCACADFQILHD